MVGSASLAPAFAADWLGVLLSDSLQVISTSNASSRAETYHYNCDYACMFNAGGSEQTRIQSDTTLG